LTIAQLQLIALPIQHRLFHWLYSPAGLSRIPADPLHGCAMAKMPHRGAMPVPVFERLDLRNDGNVGAGACLMDCGWTPPCRARYSARVSPLVSRLGRAKGKSNGRLSFQGRPLLDRLNSFGKFDGRSIHTACMFGTGRAHVAQAYRRGSTDASLVPVCGNFAQGYRRSSRRRSSSGQ